MAMVRQKKSEASVRSGTERMCRDRPSAGAAVPPWAAWRLSRSRSILLMRLIAGSSSRCSKTPRTRARARARHERGRTRPAYRPPLREVVLRLLARQSSKVVLEGDALAQLADRLMRKPLVELGLAEQDHLDELALFGFEVGQQPQRFERFQRHRLSLVEAHHDALFLAREIEEREGQRLEQMMLVEPAVELHLHLLGKGQQQRLGLEVRVGNVCADPVVVKRGEELAAHQRLSRAHLACDL